MDPPNSRTIAKLIPYNLIADVPLSRDSPDQVASGEFFHHQFRITFGRGRDGLERLFAGPGQTCI